MRRPVLLVGLPGAGKSTVGRLTAETLGAPHHDIDATVAARAGMPVERIFAEHGEAHFRDLERAAVAAALAGPPAVVTPGAGWAAQPGALDAARAAGAYVVYLRCDLETATRRATDGTEARPLLAGADPRTRMAALLEARRSWYERADAACDTDAAAPPAVAAAVARLARLHAGW